MANDQNGQLQDENTSLRARNNDLTAQNRDLELKLSNMMYQRNLENERTQEALNRSSFEQQKREINQSSQRYLDVTHDIPVVEQEIRRQPRDIPGINNGLSMEKQTHYSPLRPKKSYSPVKNDSYHAGDQGPSNSRSVQRDGGMNDVSDPRASGARSGPRGSDYASGGRQSAGR